MSHSCSQTFQECNLKAWLFTPIDSVNLKKINLLFTIRPQLTLACSIVWSLKCQKIGQTAQQNFPNTKLTYLYYLFCTTNSSKPKYIQFTIIEHEENSKYSHLRMWMPRIHWLFVCFKIAIKIVLLFNFPSNDVSDLIHCSLNTTVIYSTLTLCWKQIHLNFKPCMLAWVFVHVQSLRNAKSFNVTWNVSSSNLKHAKIKQSNYFHIKTTYNVPKCRWNLNYEHWHQRFVNVLLRFPQSYGATSKGNRRCFGKLKILLVSF